MIFEEQPQVFWATNGLLPAWGIRGIATVLTIHDLVYKFAPETLPLISLYGRRIGQGISVAKADKVVCVSYATETDALVEYGRGADAIIPPLINESLARPQESAFTYLRVRLQLPERYLLALGTLEPRKNLVSLIDAYLKRRDAGIDLPLLVIAGGNGWLDSEIANRLQLGENLGLIRRLGYVDLADLPALYFGCEVFLMPSLYEGFGMPILEAQMCGAPVIHGPHASMKEAGGHLGVVTPTDIAGIEVMLDHLSSNELPLACRLPSDMVNNADLAAAQLWNLLMEAAKSKGSRI
jgi:glycosyltransferase involved in cell wall biosynthesis